jgi:Subunit CCDC53 of WASH complex
MSSRRQVFSPKPKLEALPPPPPPPSYKATGSRPALKDDPKFEGYFRMLKMGLPLEVAKHAMVRDGLDPSVLDLDHNKPVGVP